MTLITEYGLYDVRLFSANNDLRLLTTTFSLEVRAGEDDGSVEFELVDSRDQTRIVVHLLCSGESIVTGKTHHSI